MGPVTARVLSTRGLRLAAVVLLAAACAPGSPSPGDSAAESGPGNPGTLVIYSGRSESLVGPIIQEFRDLTGVQVEVQYGGTPAMAASLLEEGTNSPADIFYAQDPGGLGAVAHMLAPLPPSVLERAPEWARSADGHWVGVSARARTLVYNVNRVEADELPADIWDLTDSKWRGRIGWAPTNGSFLTMVAGMRHYWGEEKTRQWIEGIVANEPRVYPNNSSQVEAAAAGEIDVGMVNHYYLYRFLTEQGESFPARNYHPTTGPGALVMISGAGILSTSRNKENAERFVSFLLSTVAQQYFAGQTYEYPLVDGVNIHRLLTPLDQINRPDIGMAELADLEGATEMLRQAGALP